MTYEDRKNVSSSVNNCVTQNTLPCSGIPKQTSVKACHTGLCLRVKSEHGASNLSCLVPASTEKVARKEFGEGSKRAVRRQCVECTLGETEWFSAAVDRLECVSILFFNRQRTFICT